MRRKEAPQFLNQQWVPEFYRNRMTEFLTWFVGLVGAARPFVPVIMEGLALSREKQIFPIAQNVGAGFESVAPYLDFEIQTEEISWEHPDFSKPGLYLSVNGFHQLPAPRAKAFLERIAESGNPVVIVEGNNDSLRQIIGMTIIVPLTVLLTAPFVKPFRISRLIFTYLVPLLPITILIDGCMALFKLYNPSDLKELTDGISVNSYHWEAGKRDNGRGGKIIYLIGGPRPAF